MLESLALNGFQQLNNTKNLNNSKQKKQEEEKVLDSVALERRGRGRRSPRKTSEQANTTFFRDLDARDDGKHLGMELFSEKRSDFHHLFHRFAGKWRQRVPCPSWAFTGLSFHEARYLNNPIWAR